MMMEPFYSKFPKIAEKETRNIILPNKSHGLEAGEYALVESYCNDQECDCRRVFINVYNGETPIATIGYGWEELKFYEKWMGDTKLAKDAKGQILELGGFNSKYDEAMLQLFKNIMLRDTAFIERLKKHYVMFKEK